MWQTLENHYEGNVQVRSKKVELHMYEYELFKMKPHEIITEMINCLNALVTTLRKLGKLGKSLRWIENLELPQLRKLKTLLLSQPMC